MFSVHSARYHAGCLMQSWERGLELGTKVGRGLTSFPGLWGEKEMATHSSVLTWRIPGTGEPGGLPSMGSHRVGHDWSDLAAAAATWGEKVWQIQRLKEISEPGCRMKWNEVKSLSHVRLFATPWTVAYQAPPFTGFSRQEYWSGLPFPSPGVFPTQGLNPGLPHSRQTL